MTNDELYEEILKLKSENERLTKEILDLANRVLVAERKIRRLNAS